MTEINLKEYDYGLPDERIAQYPVGERDMSKLLHYRKGIVSEDVFRNIGKYIRQGSLLVFNNTRVIRARMLFRKESGAHIEIFCLEPLNPSDYESAFSSGVQVEWKCIIGNLKRWKSGIIKSTFEHKGVQYTLSAEKTGPEGDAFRVRFVWQTSDLTFGEVLDALGHIPLPPYIGRSDEESDLIRYQTVYSTIKGSVAAPTAGLHFTENVIKNLSDQGIWMSELTLHVGAGTFQPVRGENISDHEMHCEHFFVTADTINLLIEKHGSIIPVGTTSVRTLESLYWLGLKVYHGKAGFDDELMVDQWEPYNNRETIIPVKESLKALSDLMKSENRSFLKASTKIIIVPGYEFKVINGLITNFHQPKSTLLLLISAWIGDDWKKVYDYALKNNFRFLSYGDSSLLLR